MMQILKKADVTTMIFINEEAVFLQEMNYSEDYPAKTHETKVLDFKVRKVITAIRKLKRMF